MNVRMKLLPNLLGLEALQAGTVEGSVCAGRAEATPSLGQSRCLRSWWMRAVGMGFIEATMVWGKLPELRVLSLLRRD